MRSIAMNSINKSKRKYDAQKQYFKKLKGIDTASMNLVDILQLSVLLKMSIIEIQEMIQNNEFPRSADSKWGKPAWKLSVVEYWLKFKP